MDIIDTRDLYERQQELQEEKDTLENALEEAQEALSDIDVGEDTKEEKETVAEAQEALDEWLAEYQEELDELNNLEKEVGSEWIHGMLIPEDDFVAYCQELLDDIGDIPHDLPSYIVIDWDATAENLKNDYSETDYQGTTYLFRSN